MKITSEEAASDQLRLSLRKYRAPALVLATVLVHLFVAARSVGPMYVFDEIGYLAAGNVMSGPAADWSLCGSSYAVGYSAVLAPLWWLPVTPVGVYQIAAFVSAALGALVMWPATALAKRFGAPGGIALCIGALVTLVPARALMDNYVLAENPLTLLVVCAALLAVRLAHDGRRLDTVLLGTVAGLAAVVHTRAIPLVAVTLAWLAIRAVLKRTRWLDAVVAGAVALVLTIGGFVAQTLMGGQIFADDSRVGDLVGQLNVVRIGEVILGQAFTQVVSWALLTTLGLLAVVSYARADARRTGVRSVASAWWWLGAMVLAQAGFFVWVLASSADFGTRFDIPIFGRYLDPFVVPLAVLGAVTLWVSARRRLATVALVASAVAVGAYGLLVLPRVSLDAVWIPFAVPGLNPFLDASVSDDRPGLAIAGVVGLVTCALLWASTGRAKLGVLASLAVATAMTLGADVWRVDPFEAEARATTVTSEFVLAHPDVSATMAYDLLPCLERNKIQFELAGNVKLVPTDGDFGSGLVVGPKDWPAAEAAGLGKILFTTWLEASVWADQG